MELHLSLLATVDNKQPSTFFSCLWLCNLSSEIKVRVGKRCGRGTRWAWRKQHRQWAIEEGRKLTTSPKTGPGRNSPRWALERLRRQCQIQHEWGPVWPTRLGESRIILPWSRMSYWNTAPLHLSCYTILVLCGSQDPTWRMSALYTSFSLFNRKMSLEGVGGKLQFSIDLPLLAASWMGDARSLAG